MLSHDDLSASLAAHLAGEQRMVWENMQLGPAGSPRPDVYAIMRSFAHPAPMAYECKVSRSDFLADVTAGKWTSYLPYAYGVVFACEGDLLKKTDVPQHCGLIVLKSGWRLAKRPVLNPVRVPQEALLKLLIDGVTREGPAMRMRRWSESIVMDKLSKKFGKVVAEAVRDRVAVERETEWRREGMERRRKDEQARADENIKRKMEILAPLRRELTEALGLPADAEVYAIQHAVRKLREESQENPAAYRHRMLTSQIRSALERFAFEEEKNHDEVEVT